MEIFTEQIYIYANKILEEVLLIIVQENIYIMNFDASEMLFQPVNVLTDVEQIIKCLRQNNRDEYQSIAI